MASNIGHEHFSKASNYLRKKNYKAAYRELHAGLAVEPTSYYGHRALGYVAGKLKKYEEWAEERRYLLRGYGQFENKNSYSEFVPRPNISIPSPAFTSVFTLLTDLGLSEFRRGRTMRSQTALRQSLVYFNKILSYDPNYIWLDTMRAWCHIELNQFDAAETILNRDIKLCPELTCSYIVLSRLRYRQKRTLQAALVFLQGIFVFVRYLNPNIISHTSEFHFATKAEEDKYFASRLVRTKTV